MSEWMRTPQAAGMLTLLALLAFGLFEGTLAFERAPLIMWTSLLLVANGLGALVLHALDTFDARASVDE